MALTDSDDPPRARAFASCARCRAWLASEHGATQRMAGTAFVIRVTGAAVIFLSQILLARWMGGVEFGIYVYAWTWLQMIGDIIHLGLAAHRATHHPRIHPARRFRRSARLPVRQPLDRLCGSRPCSRSPARSPCMRSSRRSTAARSCRSISPACAAALRAEQHARRAGARLQRRQYRAAAAFVAAPAHADRR